MRRTDIQIHESHRGLSYKYAMRYIIAVKIKFTKNRKQKIFKNKKKTKKKVTYLLKITI